MARKRTWLLFLAAFAIWGQSRTTPEARPHPVTTVVPFDSIVVTNAVFSPNGDGVRDEASFAFKVPDTLQVRIVVTHPDSTVPLATLFDQRILPSPVATTVRWNGNRSGGVAAADGRYAVRFTGSSVGATPVVYENQRPVRVDRIPPRVTIRSLTPRLFSPDLTAANVRVVVGVSTSDPADSLRVLVLPESLALRAVDVFRGDGDYTFDCDACRNTNLPDGLHPIRARAFDAAGNVTIAVDTLDKNSRKPVIQRTHPPTSFVQRADSVTGRIFDRHGLRTASMRAIWAGGSAAIPLSLANPVPPDSAYRFRADVSTALASEEAYTLRIFATDSPGLRDSVTTRLTVDRTPPNAPDLAPRPNPVVLQPYLNVSLRVDSTMARVARQGGSSSADTLSVGSRSLLTFEGIPLLSGPNLLTFRALDASGNVSEPETTTVAWRPSSGIAAPERFRAGNSIQVETGSAPAAATLNIYALDGNLVGTWRSSPRLVHDFVWDLRTPDGKRVKNGAYLLQVSVQASAPGVEERHFRKLIAVIE